MKLDSYLRERRLTSAQFAETAGIGGKQTVHQYRHGLRFPTPENLRRIREATNGAVTADDFVDQHAGASPPPTPPKRAAAKAPAPEPTPPPKPRAKAKPAPLAGAEAPAAAKPKRDRAA